MHKGLKLLAIAFTGAALALVVAFVVAVVAFHWSVTTVSTGSMEPAIPVGSLVALAPVEPDAVGVGEVVLYSSPLDRDIRITHRVTEVVDSGQGPMFRTRGDANEDPDPYLVPAGNVDGAVRLCVPYAGYITRFAGSPAGFVTLILIPGIAIAGIVLKELVTYSHYRHRRGGVLSSRTDRRRRMLGA